MSYKIGLANISDADKIIDFIKNNWKKNHIVTNKEFLLYEFGDGLNLNFVIAKNEYGEILGLIGFIKKSYGLSVPDIFTSFWKVLDDVKVPSLGIEIFNYLRKNIPHRSFMGVGINEKIIPIFKLFKMFTSEMQQYYMLNQFIDEYQIAVVKNNKVGIANQINSNLKVLTLIEDTIALESIDFNRFSSNIPFKDSIYIEKRYFSYPIHKYDVYSIGDNGIIVLREVYVNNSKIARIVDFVGDISLIPKIAGDLYYIMVENNYEYIDFLNYGIKDDILSIAGFEKLDYSNDEIIVPQYFSPFLRENKKIYFFADTSNENFIICKADGDQDRPSI